MELRGPAVYFYNQCSCAALSHKPNDILSSHVVNFISSSMKNVFE